VNACHVTLFGGQFKSRIWLFQDGNSKRPKRIEVLIKGARSQQAPKFGSINCPVPCDYLPKRSYPLFRAREVLEYLALGGAGGSPEGDQRRPLGPEPRRVSI